VEIGGKEAMLTIKGGTLCWWSANFPCPIIVLILMIIMAPPSDR